MTEKLTVYLADEHGRVREWHCTVNVTAFMPGGIKDWPNNIQDGVYAALEKASGKSRLSLHIIASKCDHDIEHGYYIHVVAVAIRPLITS